MQKLGKWSIAIAMGLIMSLTLFTSGVFAQSANHSTAKQKAQAVVATNAAVPSTTILATGWGGGCFDFDCGGGRFTRITRIIHIVRITHITKIFHAERFNRFGGFGGFGGGGGFGDFGGDGGFGGW
jgi:hypothetical protein